MKLDWQQLSPRERDTALRHYILHDKLNSTVTAQVICEEMSRTHFLYTDQALGGRSVFKFVPGKGKSAGVAVSDDVSEGVYKAALRALGVEVCDRNEKVPAIPARSRGPTSARAQAH
jgi:hypothetical protein